MLRKIYICACLLAAPLFADVNLIRNADFSDGLNHFGFSDATPDRVGARIGEDPAVGKYLAYKTEKDGWAGLNFSEIYLGEKGKFVFSFKAKASAPIQMHLVALRLSDVNNNIYRHDVRSFKLDGEWREFKIDVDLSKIRGKGEAWTPFRIEKYTGDPAKAFPQAAEIFFADFKLVPAGGDIDAVKLMEKAAFSAEVSVSAKGKKRKSPYMAFDRRDNLRMIAKFANGTGEVRRAKASVSLKKQPFGETIYEDTCDLEIPAGKSSVKFNIGKIARNGRYLAELKVNGEDIGCVNFAITPRVRAKRGELPIDIGYCGVITNGEMGSPTAEEMSFLAETGISIIRTWDSGNPFNWRCIEPEEGKYFWDITDETVRLACENNLDVLPVLGGMFFIYPPEMGIRGHRQAPWLYAKSEVSRAISGFEKQGRKTIKPPMEDWNRMVTAVASRYKGKITHFEIMNEPNIIWADYMIYYPYLESASKIIRGMHPDNKVVGFSTTGDYGGNPNGFLAILLRAGAGKFSDIISFHSYNSLFEDSKKPADKLIEDFHESLAKNGVNQPLWHTELYYMNPKSAGGGDHANGPVFHAGYLARRYMLDAANNVAADVLLPASFVVVRERSGSVNVSNFSKGRHVCYPSQGAAGIFIPSDCYIVSAVFADTLKGTKFSKKRPLKDKLLAYEFASPEGAKKPKAVAAVFALEAVMDNLSTNRSNLKTEISDPLKRAPKNIGKLPDGVKVFDVFGNKINTSSDGTVTLPISPIPVYFTAPDPALIDEVLKRLE